MTDSDPDAEVFIRNTEPRDYEQIRQLCVQVYPNVQPWSERQLDSHRKVFPEGQFVAVLPNPGAGTEQVVGMAATLILRWDEYEIQDNYIDFTDGGLFTNHDPEGRTLYGAEVMVSPTLQGKGIGKKIYAARRKLVRERKLLRIRAGARLRDYHQVAGKMSPEEYVEKVTAGEIGDRTLSFQLRQGFEVVAVVHRYLQNDPESLGHAAIIEWLNPEVATEKDYLGRNPRYLTPEARRFQDSLAAHYSGPLPGIKNSK